MGVSRILSARNRQSISSASATTDFVLRSSRVLVDLRDGYWVVGLFSSRQDLGSVFLFLRSSTSWPSLSPLPLSFPLKVHKGLNLAAQWTRQFSSILDLSLPDIHELRNWQGRFQFGFFVRVAVSVFFSKNCIEIILKEELANRLTKKKNPNLALYSTTPEE